jgi:hypothetical protein
VYKTFGGIAALLDTAALEYERVIHSPNGEDVLFAFHARVEGRSLLLPYNMIRKEFAAPLSCHGWALFDDGTLMVLRADSDEPTRVHPLQLWRSPYVSDTYAAAYVRAQTLGGPEDAPLTRAVAALGLLADRISAVESAINRAADPLHPMANPTARHAVGPRERASDST